MVRSGSSNKSLAHAKVVGTTCNVCDPEDVHNLANFALNELGSIDIWVSHELTLGFSCTNWYYILIFLKSFGMIFRF